MTPLRRARERLLAQPVGGPFSLFLVLGAILTVAGFAVFVLALQGENTDRAWHLFLVNWLFFSSLATGSVALAAVHKLAHAKWSGVILRYAEACVAFLPFQLIGLLLVFGPGYHHIWPHMEGLSHGKELWLSRPWMFGRLLVGLLALHGIAYALIRRDLLPDMRALLDRVPEKVRTRFQGWLGGYDGSAETESLNENRIKRLAGIYIVLYAVVLSMIAFDTIMALQPHWFSNLLGGWFFMGAFLAAHMLLALISMYGSGVMGMSDLISPKQRHDLGKLCFGFTVFWAYLMWSQFLVIWYGNLPEETGFVFARLWGPWLPVGRLVFLGMFVIPFVGLLGVAPKKFKPTLALFATVSLVALWLERYLLVLPSVTAEPGPVFGMPELGPTLGFLGLFLLCYGLFAQYFPMISPRLAMITLEGEAHHLATAEGMYEHDESEGDYAAEATD